MIRFFKQAVLFCILAFVVQMVVSMEWEIEHDLQTGKFEALRAGIPTPYKPDAEILSVQKHQVEQPKLGFIWKPSIRIEDNVILGWGDSPAGALSTDDIGFANSEETIAMRQNNEKIDVIGVGASYMGGGANLFHEYFSLNGYFYYNMAHGRFTLPQYNVALKEYALPQKPKWIIYGLNEVSYTLIPDFEAWQKSGIGWFDFHSGTWCGPSLKYGFPHDQLKKHSRLYRIYQSFSKKTFHGAFDKKTTRKELVDKTYYYIEDAYRACKERGVGFVVLLIPSKVRMTQGRNPSLFLFEEIIPKLKQHGIQFIDLTGNFSQVDDPSSLYFHYDAHWNNTGMYRAAREIITYIENSGNNSRTDDHE